MIVEHLNQEGTSHSSSDLLKIRVKMDVNWSAQAGWRHTVWSWSFPEVLPQGDLTNFKYSINGPFTDLRTFPQGSPKCSSPPWALTYKPPSPHPLNFLGFKCWWLYPNISLQCHVSTLCVSQLFIFHHIVLSTFFLKE